MLRDELQNLRQSYPQSSKGLSILQLGKSSCCPHGAAAANYSADTNRTTPSKSSSNLPVVRESFF